MKNKKLFAILTLVCFMFTLMPVAAMAEETVYVAEINGVPYETLAAAVNVANTTTQAVTIKLLDRVELSKGITINNKNGVTITIDGDDKTITTAEDKVFTGLVVTVRSNLEIKNVTFDDIETTSDIVNAYKGADLSVDGCTFNNTESRTVVRTQSGYANTVTINNSVFTSNGAKDGMMYSGGSGGTYVITNCKFNSNTCTAAAAPITLPGTVSIKNSEFAGNETTSDWSYAASSAYCWGGNTTFTANTLSGNTVKATGSTGVAAVVVIDGDLSGNTMIDNKVLVRDTAESSYGAEQNIAVYVREVEDGSVTISSGEIAGTITSTNGTGIFVTGGTFTVDPTDYLAEGKCIVKDTTFIVGEHNPVGVVTEPTCTEKGYTTYTCPNCDDTYTADEVAALGHTEVTVPGKAATCKDTGLTEGKVCDVCDEVIIAQEVIPVTDVHTLEAVAKVNPTYDAIGMEAHNKCTVCGKLFVDGVEKVEADLVIDKLVYTGGGGSYVPSTPSTSDKTESSTTTTTTPSGDTVKVETETKADGTTVETTTTTTATGETTKVEVTTETNDEGTKVETTVTTDAQGETSTTVTATLDNGSAVTNNDAAVELEVTKVEETVVETVQEAVAADDNIEVVGTADNAVSVSATNAATGAAQTSFTQPMAVNVPVDNTVLNNVEDTSKLTLAKVVTNEDGTTELVYVGGSYDEETGTFNAKVNEDGDYILVEKADLVKIELNIGEVDIKHNDKATAMEVAPRINEDNRTMLQLSYIADALGCQTYWDGATRTVTVVKGDITLTMVIDEVIPGYDTKAVVENGRTLVPAGYISGMLGANVIWDPIDQQIIIVK